MQETAERGKCNGDKKVDSDCGMIDVCELSCCTVLVEVRHCSVYHKVNEARAALGRGIALTSPSYLGVTRVH